MDRLASRLAAAAFAFATLAPAGAQSLQTLHVRAFDLSADRTALRVGETFHLTLDARVDEPVLELDDVTLPDLSGFDVLGDERRCSSSGRGSACTETLTLEPAVVGERTLGPVTMDAIDGRNRRPSRFATNTVRVRVAGASAITATGSALIASVFGALRALLIVALVVVAFVALRCGFHRSRAVAPAVPVPPLAPTAPVVDPDARVHALVVELLNAPTRAHALALRTALRERFGARDDETMHDLRARAAAGGAYTVSALAAVERAAFCEDDRVARAVEEALPFLKV